MATTSSSHDLSRPSVPVLHDARVANLLAMRASDVESAEVLLALAQAFNARSMPARAREACDELLALDPGNSEGWFEAVIARSFGGPEELEVTAEALERRRAETPAVAWIHRTLGLAYYHLERDEDARAACDRALELDPDDGRSHEVLAYLAYTVGDLDAAVESGIKAVELEPSNHRALHWLGECYLKLDAPEQAVRYFHRCLRIEESFFFALESLGSVYLEDETCFPMAWQCFAKILSVNPRYFPVYFRLADAFIQADRLTEAAAQAEAVLHLMPDATAEADAHQYLGLLAVMGSDLDVARGHFERALEIDPDFAAAHHYLGVVAEREGDLESAEESFRKAVSRDPEYPNPRVRLGYLAFDRKEYESARRHFETALEIDDEEYMAHLGLGELARWRKDYQEQLEHCLAAAALAPDDGNVQNQLGTAHDALGRWPEAVAAYERALRIDPLNRQAANNLGFLYERMLKEVTGPDADDLREKAVSAWKRRLLICRDTRSSTRGARNHLLRLGVLEETVDDWLEHGQLVP